MNQYVSHESSDCPDPPLRVSWCSVSPDNVEELRRLNAAVFPVHYNDQFYQDVLAGPSDFVRLAYVGSVLAGAVCCRTESCAEEPSEEGEVASSQPSTTAAATLVSLNASTAAFRGLRGPDVPSAGVPLKLYIMTLGVLPAYRERGIGGQLLRYILKAALESPDAAGVREVYLHVQVGNDDALSFYIHHGFNVKGRLWNYYRKIQPADCFYVYCDISRPVEKHRLQSPRNSGP
jgi:N-alpha-acetyltransferase 50